MVFQCSALAFSILANQLHNNTGVCLSELILANLYESLSEGAARLKNLDAPGAVHLNGPLWLLQLWLNATFEANLPRKGQVNEDSTEIKERRTDGICLVQLTPKDDGESLQEAFSSYVMMFAKQYDFTPSMAPFAARKCGPE